MNSNPVVNQAASATTAIVLIKAIITYFRTMGWWDVDQARYDATFEFVDVVVPIVAVWVGAFLTMRKVTSRSNPTDVDGTPLSRPGDVPPIPQMKKIQEEAIRINEKISQEIDERRIQRE